MYYITLLALSVLFVIGGASDDLYQILAVRKSATKQEIKAAYKKLAMEWHPDRNDDPNANERFMKINEAYETLSDPEKKEQYDRFGRTSATNDLNQGHQSRHFSSFFGGNFRFDFGAGGGVNEELIEKFNVNHNLYKNRVLPESKYKPYLLYVYADFCMRCVQVEKMWDKIVSDLENIGMGIGTVHANIARSLVYELKINSVPSIAIVIDGKPKLMQGELSVRHIREFIRSIIPKYVVQQVNDHNYEEFLSGWQDNKVRMLFCDSKYDPSLRYLLPAFASKHRFIAGYVDIKDGNTHQLLAKFRIQQTRETLLIFHEDIQHPAAQVGMNVLPRSTIDELMESNKHLQLPRLSSQEVLNELCPPYSSIKRKSLCVVLLTQNTPAHNPHRDSLRNYAQRHRIAENRVKYTYVYQDTQSHFVDTLIKGESIINATSGALKVAIMWRKDRDVIQYDWLEDGWYTEGPKLDEANERLGLMVSDWLYSKQALPFLTSLRFDLYNEHGYDLPYRIYVRLWEWYDITVDWIFSVDEVSIVMIITSVLCLGLVYMMLRSVLDFDDRGDHRREQQRRQFHEQQHYRHQYEKPRVDITHLISNNFDGFVMRQEAGVRVLVLFVDDSTKMKLVEKFASAVEPFSKGKAFKFAFMNLEDYLPWLKHLLEDTIDNKTRNLSNINARNCLGTVLALNGPRKSYSVYHAHAERNRSLTDRQVEGFLGFDGSEESNSDEEQADKLFESDLLFRLQPWLERLCEGTVKKFKIEKWPAFE